MSETTNNRTIFSLSEVTLSIQKTLSERYTSAFWIKAEMNKLNHYPQSGHCYPDLVEKTDGKIVAEMRATIWKEDFQRISENFLNVLHEPLKNGIRILFYARIAFNPVYGLSLRILDIDPSWSLGELEREKQETIARIKKEGIWNLNRSLELPLLPKRIAVISVGTSKGYADFCKILGENEWGYSIFHMLFPALLQGENAVGSILNQMERIKTVRQHFDAVAIIRGGGGDVGLTCYNHYELARAVALFPLPVITGIGHSTNETVAEMIAFKNAITPTELADFLIQKFHNFAVPLASARETILAAGGRTLQDANSEVKTIVQYFKTSALARLTQGNSDTRQEANFLLHASLIFIQQRRERHVRQNLAMIERGLTLALKASRVATETNRTALMAMIKSYLKEQDSRLTDSEKSIELLNPERVLNRGYTITLANGKAVTSVGQVKEGMRLTTLTGDGEIISVTETTNKTGNND